MRLQAECAPPVNDHIEGMTGNMPNRRLRALAFALVVPLAFAGCDKFEARTAFKQANVSYKNENYREAIAGYERGLRSRSVGHEGLALPRSRGDGDLSARRHLAAEPRVREDRARRVREVRRRLPGRPQGAGVHPHRPHGQRAVRRRAEASARASRTKNPNDKPTLQAITSILVARRSSTKPTPG